MSNDTTPPIEISPNQLPGQAGTLLRYILTTVGGYALGKGWIDDQLLQVLTALITVIAPLAYGMYKTWIHKSQLVVTAEAAPNSVAVVK